MLPLPPQHHHVILLPHCRLNSPGFETMNAPANIVAGQPGVGLTFRTDAVPSNKRCFQV
jgi:hypothetical protein